MEFVNDVPDARVARRVQAEIVRKGFPEGRMEIEADVGMYEVLPRATCQGLGFIVYGKLKQRRLWQGVGKLWEY